MNLTLETSSKGLHLVDGWHTLWERNSFSIRDSTGVVVWHLAFERAFHNYDYPGKRFWLFQLWSDPAESRTTPDPIQNTECKEEVKYFENDSYTFTGRLLYCYALRILEVLVEQRPVPELNYLNIVERAALKSKTAYEKGTNWIRIEHRCNTEPPFWETFFNLEDEAGAFLEFCDELQKDIAAGKWEEIKADVLAYVADKPDLQELVREYTQNL